MKFLIVGLGNIGAEYAATRHNIGFAIVDALAAAADAVFSAGRYGDTAQIPVKGHRLILLKPSTYVNLSGKAVNYWMQHERIPIENVLVVVDDIALPFGAIRLRTRGSDGGHNGLSHIILTLNSDAFPRLRFGIGGDFPKGLQVDYVLGRWSHEEEKLLPERIETACEAIKSFAAIGLERTMNGFNKK